jgi:hypothetical protein
VGLDCRTGRQMGELYAVLLAMSAARLRQGHGTAVLIGWFCRGTSDGVAAGHRDGRLSAIGGQSRNWCNPGGALPVAR